MRESPTATILNALRWQLAALAVEAKLVRVRLALKVFNPFQRASRPAPGRAGNGPATAPRIGPATVP